MRSRGLIVEAIAVTMFKQMVTKNSGVPWEDLPERRRDEWRECARLLYDQFMALTRRS
jgi:hypothetical protein